MVSHLAVVGVALTLQAADLRPDILFGEVHGIVGNLTYVEEVVLNSAAEGPVVLGLELPEAGQEIMDAYWASNASHLSANEVRSMGWCELNDGRTSVELIEHLARLKIATRQRNLEIELFAQAPPYATDFETIATRSNFVSALHGASLQHIQRTHDEARFIAVIGNYHGSRSITAFPDELGGSESIRAAHFLGASVETVMLGHELGGRYGCNFDGCGINEVQNLIGPWPGFDRTVNTGPAVPVRPLQGSPYCETALE